MARTGRDAGASRARPLHREIDRLVDAIAKGQGDPAVLGPRSTALDEERRRVPTDLAAALPPTEVLALHPVMLTRYEEQLTRLQLSLAGGINAGNSECSQAMRDLVETVTVFRDPTKAGGVQVEIAGRLTALLGEQASPIVSKECGDRW